MGEDGKLFGEEATDHSAKVEVLSTRFRAPDGGFAVLTVEDTQAGDVFPLVGPVAHLNDGDRAQVSGEWHNHPQHGRQLQARAATPIDPDDREGQISYLTSLPNIGPARAESLVDAHGEDVLEAIAVNPAAIFGSLQGLNPEQVDAAAEAWGASRTVRDLHVQLGPHGLAHLAVPIHDHFGEHAMTVLREDPYRLTEVSGVGFTRADTIALGLGVERDSERRAQAAAVYAVAKAEQQGDTFIPIEELSWRTAKLLGLQPDPDVLVAAPGLVIDENRVYRARTHETELAVAGTLLARAQAPPELEHEPAETPPQDEEHSKGLTEEQWAAVRGAFGSRVSVVTGGPGVGKTICTKAIVGEALKAQLRIYLCAPTGRAARRMQDATGHEAETIHRMLEWIPGNEPKIGPSHPLPADLVVIDEASMLNLSTMGILLSGLAEATHVVFVGDADQLPPIGAGKPFDDLIASEVVPVVRLSLIFRQAAKSMITTAAHAINRGQMPRLAPEEDQEQDFFFIERENPQKALETVVEVVAERVPERFGVDPIRDVQVLAPMRKGPIGINALNRELRARLNPRGANPPVADQFRIGDRLMQTRNAHDLGLMNGSIVIVRADDEDAGAMVVETDDGGELAIPYGETTDLEFAYAITVHKAQGCEVPVVVALCHNSQAVMLTRPLLYTAITRARRGCILAGEKSALEAGARRGDSSRRNSALVERLRG